MSTRTPVEDSGSSRTASWVNSQSKAGRTAPSVAPSHRSNYPPSVNGPAGSVAKSHHTQRPEGSKAQSRAGSQYGQPVYEASRYTESNTGSHMVRTDKNSRHGTQRREGESNTREENTDKITIDTWTNRKGTRNRLSITFSNMY